MHADDWQRFRAVRLAALRDAPDAFGTTLAQWQGAADTEARWRARLTGVPFNVLAERAGAAIGMIGATAPVDGAVELIALWVAPEARGCGVGATLVYAVLDWARAEGCTCVRLGVRAANRSAIALYRRCGFVDLGARPAADGQSAERAMACALG